MVEEDSIMHATASHKSAWRAAQRRHRGRPIARPTKTTLRFRLLALAAFALSPVPCEAFSARDLRSILTYDEMMTRLERIAAYGQDARLSEAPYHAEATGWAIPVVTVGHGPRAVFITAMQHANEYRVGDAAVRIAQKLSRPRNAWMRSALTVVIMPRVNVDGFDHTLPGEP